MSAKRMLWKSTRLTSARASRPPVYRNIPFGIKAIKAVTSLSEW